MPASRAPLPGRGTNIVDDSCAKRLTASAWAGTAAVTLLLHQAVRAPDTHKRAAGARSPFANLPATMLAATTALALVLPIHAAESLQANAELPAPWPIANLFGNEITLESSLHVTSFTARSCEALHAAASPEASNDFAVPVAVRSVTAHGPSGGRGLPGLARYAEPDSDGVASLKRGRLARELAACLATPPEPAKSLQRARVVTQTQCERLGECEADFLLPEEVEEAMSRARRWLKVSRRLGIRQARGVFRFAQERGDVAPEL